MECVQVNHVVVCKHDPRQSPPSKQTSPQLHRNFGKLHTAQNKLDEALSDLSKDIYCSSLEVGPEHIDTSAGYFLMANIFYAQRKVSRITIGSNAVTCTRRMRPEYPS